MNVFEVNNLDEYAQCIKFAFNQGGENTYGDEEPLFSDITEFIDEELIAHWWDDDGNPKWDYESDEDDYPDELYQEIAKIKLDSLLNTGLIELPFFVVIGGGAVWGRMGDEITRIFYETNVGNLKDYGRLEDE
jgi:hypothetical protein